MRNWSFNAPLGIKTDEYKLLGPAGREFCWRRRFNIPPDEPIPAAVINETSHMYWKDQIVTTIPELQEWFRWLKFRYRHPLGP